MSNKKIRYTCPEGHILVAKITEEKGFPPSHIKCMGFQCNELAKAGEADRFDIPVMEIRLPTNDEAKELPDYALEFLGAGGLLLFKLPPAELTKYEILEPKQLPEHVPTDSKASSHRDS